MGNLEQIPDRSQTGFKVEKVYFSRAFNGKQSLTVDIPGPRGIEMINFNRSPISPNKPEFIINNKYIEKDRPYISSGNIIKASYNSQGPRIMIFRVDHSYIKSDEYNKDTTYTVVLDCSQESLGKDFPINNPETLTLYPTTSAVTNCQSIPGTAVAAASSKSSNWIWIIAIVLLIIALIWLLAK